MSALLAGPEPSLRRSGAGQRFPALLWSLLHVPIFLALFAPGIEAALRATPEQFRPWLWPTFLPQATLLAFLAWMLALPFSLGAPRLPLRRARGDGPRHRGRRARRAGLRLRRLPPERLLLPRPDSSRTRSRRRGSRSGASSSSSPSWRRSWRWTSRVGAWFIRRFASSRRAWALALALVLLSDGGAGLRRAPGPLRRARRSSRPPRCCRSSRPCGWAPSARRVFGKRGADPFRDPARRSGSPPASRPRRSGSRAVAGRALHRGREPPRRAPLRADDAAPVAARAGGRALRRATTPARRSTNYTLFTLMYGLQAQKLEATVGAGRRPILFPALAANGYQLKVLAASCVDWMDLKDTVFGGVPADDLKTWCDDVEPPDRDATMIRSAEAFAAAADPARPVFLFMFFFGTHFNYFHDEEDRSTCRSGTASDALKATRAPGEHIAEPRAQRGAQARPAPRRLPHEVRADAREGAARRVHRRSRRGVPGEGAHRPRLRGDERADPRPRGLDRPGRAAGALRRSDEPRRRRARRCSRCSATTTRPRSTPTAQSMFDARRPTASSPPPSGGSR